MALKKREQIKNYISSVNSLVYGKSIKFTILRRLANLDRVINDLNELVGEEFDLILESLGSEKRAEVVKRYGSYFNFLSSFKSDMEAIIEDDLESVKRVFGGEPVRGINVCIDSSESFLYACYEFLTNVIGVNPGLLLLYYNYKFNDYEPAFDMLREVVIHEVGEAVIVNDFNNVNEALVSETACDYDDACRDLLEDVKEALINWGVSEVIGVEYCSEFVRFSDGQKSVLRCEYGSLGGLFRELNKKIDAIDDW